MRPAKTIKNFEKIGCEEVEREWQQLWGLRGKRVSFLLTWIGLMCRYLKTDCKEPFGREELNIKDARKKNKNAPGYDVSEMEGGVGAGGAQSTGREWTCTWRKVGFSLEEDQNEV